MAPIPAAGQPAVQPVPPQTDLPMASNVPLAPIPDQQGMYQPNPVPLAPLAPMPEVTTNIANSNAVAPIQETTTPNQTVTSSTTSSSVPLAPFPDPAKQTGQQSSATTFAIFNISVYTIISCIVASMF